MYDRELVSDMFDQITHLHNEVFKRDIEIIRLQFELQLGRSIKESFADLHRSLLSQQ